LRRVCLFSTGGSTQLSQEGKRLFRAMRAISLVLVLLCLPSSAPLGAGDGLSAKEMMEFGLEAAKRGLWREAAFRWERSVKQSPDNARLRNNLAVAYESLGDLARAEAEYKEALRLDPDSAEIRANYESFKEVHRARLDEADRVRSDTPSGGGP
jgi:Tfp pilus assembly protein PilF